MSIIKYTIIEYRVKEMDMEHKNVSLDEMLMLLEKSKEKEHPYYYRFNYLYNKKCFVATRIRKEALNL